MTDPTTPTSGDPFAAHTSPPPPETDTPPEAEPQALEGYVSARPFLGVGSGGPDVAELAALLAAAGYENPIASGRAPAILDDALMGKVRDFQRDHGIDPTRADGDNPPAISRDHAGIVDAATWDALGARKEITR